MTLKCYLLHAGGLLAIEAVFIDMTKPDTVFRETFANFEVILLLIFMVAEIYFNFMKDFLRYTFTRILVRVQSKIHISLLFCFGRRLPFQTSAMAPVIRLSCARMVYLALLYTITISLTGLGATTYHFL